MKRLLPVLVILGVWVSSVAAREWNSRSGDFTVEAELIEVKSGNAILKKLDGSVITVPLNTLSLGDLRYINDTLKAAEAGVTGKSGAPTPSTPQVQPVPSGPKPISVPVKGARLRYAWREGQVCVYRVRINVERGEFKDNYAGDITYKVKSVRANEIQISVSGNVERLWRSSTVSERVHTFSSTTSRRPKTTLPVSMTVDDSGHVIQSDDSPHLPYFLGDLAQLAVEPFPAAGENSWAVSSDKGVSVTSIWSPYYYYGRSGIQEGMPANRKTTYTLAGTDGRQTTIAKHLELTSVPVVMGKPRLEVLGDGTLTFNNVRGVVGGLEFAMHVTVREKNRTEETPVKVSYRLLDEEEVAKLAKEAEDTKREKERPLNDKDVDAAIADLASGDTERASRAATLLAEKAPAHPYPRAAKALEPVMLSARNAGDRANAAKAMKAWACEENVPALISALNDSWPPTRSGAIEALLRFKPKQAIAPVAQRLGDPFNRDAAAMFLKAMGPMAERAVLVHMESTDPWVRKEVCEVLQVIGTRASIPVLEKAVRDSNWMVNKPAEQAMAAVKLREQISAK